MRLLVAEDDPKLLKTLMHIFTSNKFSADGVTNGRDALTYAQSMEYDGLVLDIMMPGLDGIQVLQTLRQSGVTTPALFLTARTEVEQRVEGLDAGADDYLPKPFSTAELLARVRAMLRRSQSYQPSLLACGDLTLDPASGLLQCGDTSLRLGGREFQIMELFMRSPRQVFSAERIMERIWGWDNEAEINVVWVNISNLRKKLKSIGSRMTLRANRGLGYVLEEET